MWKQKGDLYPLQPKSVPLYLLYEVSIRGGEREIEVRVIVCLRNCASLLHRLCRRLCQSCDAIEKAP